MSVLDCTICITQELLESTALWVIILMDSVFRAGKLNMPPSALKSEH